MIKVHKIRKIYVGKNILERPKFAIVFFLIFNFVFCIFSDFAIVEILDLWSWHTRSKTLDNEFFFLPKKNTKKISRISIAFVDFINT